MSIITGAVIVVGCSAVGFLVAILVVNLRTKTKKPIPVRASRRQATLPDFESIPQEATDRLNAVYERAFDALKEMDPRKPVKTPEKSGPVKQNQKTTNRQVLASMLGPSYSDDILPLENHKSLTEAQKGLKKLEKSHIMRNGDKITEVIHYSPPDPDEGLERPRIMRNFGNQPNVDLDKLLKLRDKTNNLLIEVDQTTKISKDKKRSRRVVCQKCGHKWLLRGEDKPKHCPKCHSTIWNRRIKTWRKKE